jgi:hypothetical protein
MKIRRDAVVQLANNMKKYVSLTNVYHGMLLNELSPGEVELVATDGDTNEKEAVGTLDKAYFRVLKKEILWKQQGGLLDVVEQLIEDGGWVGADEDYKEMIMLLVLNAFVKTDSNVEVEKFKKFVEDKKSGKVTYLNQYLTGDKAFNLIDIISVHIGPFISNPAELIKKMWKIDPQRGRVGVGPGEIVLSFFTGSKKGETGDLYFPGIGDVEMKSSPGRLGSGVGWSAYSDGPAHLSDLLLRKTEHQLASGEGMRDSRDKLASAAAHAITRLEFVITIIEGADIESEAREYILTYPGSSISTIRQFIETVTDTEYSDQQLEQTEENIAAIAQYILDQTAHLKLPGAYRNIPFKALTNPGVKGKEAKGLIELINDIIQFKKHFTGIQAGASTVKRKNLSWVRSAKSFFLNDYGLEKTDIIDGLGKLRTDDMGTHGLSQLSDALDKIMTNKRLTALKSHDGVTLLKSLALTIQMNSYQFQHKFPILLLANKLSADALSFHFEGGDAPNVEKNVISIFNRVYKLVDKGILDTNLDVDSANKGITMVLTNTK